MHAVTCIELQPNKEISIASLLAYQYVNENNAVVAKQNKSKTLG